MAAHGRGHATGRRFDLAVKSVTCEPVVSPDIGGDVIMVRTVEEFKSPTESLTEDVLSSAQRRDRRISSLKPWVANFLANNHTERLREFGNAQERFEGCVGRLATETHAFLTQCDEEQSVMAESLRRAADELRAQMADGEAARLEAFLQTRDGYQMREKLAGDVAALVADTRTFLGDCRARQRAVADEVQHAASKFRQHLGDGDDARQKAFGRMRKQITGWIKDLVRKVRGQLAESHGVSLKAQAAWKKLASIRPGARKTPRQG
jgi:hypothetical protein